MSHWPNDLKTIPVPVASRNSPRQRPVFRAFKLLVRSTAAVSLFYAFILWFHDNSQSHTAGGEEFRIVDSLARHRHGRKPLRGAAAEKLYL